MPDSSSTLPYHGIRILDFSQVIAGPIATHLLNASGADVIKIEAPAKGDQLRKLVFSSRQDKSRDSAAFTAINRGKRSQIAGRPGSGHAHGGCQRCHR